VAGASPFRRDKACLPFSATSHAFFSSAGAFETTLTLLVAELSAYQDIGDALVFWPLPGCKVDFATHRKSGWRLSQIPSPPSLDVVWLDSASLAAVWEARSPVSVFTRGQGASRSVIADWVAFFPAHGGDLGFSGMYPRSSWLLSRSAAGLSLDDIL